MLQDCDADGFIDSGRKNFECRIDGILRGDETDRFDCCERGGLNWEIEQLINRVDATNLLVLADDTADLDALKNAFEKAWAQMRSDGANNRRHAGPVRIVVYPGESEARSAERHALVPGPPTDPTGRFAEMNILMRLTGTYARACEHDRAMALLLASRS